MDWERRRRVVAGIVLTASLSACAAPRNQATAPPLDPAAQAVMEQTTQQVLEDGEDGQGANWSIAETGHRGTVVPTRTYQTDSGQTCREFQQTVTVRGATQIARGAACRKTEGGWQRVDYSGLTDIRLDRAAYRTPYYGYGPYSGYGPYYGYRPYYPRSSFGIFFGHGHRFGHRHYRHHHYKHHYKKHHRSGRRNPDR